MPTFRLKITQVCRVERVCLVDVIADDIASAIEQQYAGDAPGYDEPGWFECVDLLDETVREASKSDEDWVTDALKRLHDITTGNESETA